MYYSAFKTSFSGSFKEHALLIQKKALYKLLLDYPSPIIFIEQSTSLGCASKCGYIVCRFHVNILCAPV